MIALIAGGLAQFLDNHRIGNIGRIAHTQIDDIDAGAALLVF